MPVIRVEMLAGRRIEQKREPAANLTREMARIFDCAESGIFVAIDDVAKENWAVGGQLCSDQYPAS